MKHGTDSHATEKRTLDNSKMDKTEWETSKILSKILNRRELDKVAPDTVKKIEKFFEERFDEYLTTQALYETLQRTHCKLFVANIFFFGFFLLAYTTPSTTLFAKRYRHKKKYYQCHFCCDSSFRLRKIMVEPDFLCSFFGRKIICDPFNKPYRR